MSSLEHKLSMKMGQKNIMGGRLFQGDSVDYWVVKRVRHVNSFLRKARSHRRHPWLVKELEALRKRRQHYQEVKPYVDRAILWAKFHERDDIERVSYYAVRNDDQRSKPVEPRSRRFSWVTEDAVIVLRPDVLAKGLLDLCMREINRRRDVRTEAQRMFTYTPGMVAAQYPDLFGREQHRESYGKLERSLISGASVAIVIRGRNALRDASRLCRFSIPRRATAVGLQPIGQYDELRAVVNLVIDDSQKLARSSESTGCARREILRYFPGGIGDEAEPIEDALVILKPGVDRSDEYDLVSAMDERGLAVVERWVAPARPLLVAAQDVPMTNGGGGTEMQGVAMLVRGKAAMRALAKLADRSVSESVPANFIEAIRPESSG